MHILSDKVNGWLTNQIKPTKEPILIVIPTGKLLEKLVNQWYEGTGND